MNIQDKIRLLLEKKHWTPARLTRLSGVNISRLLASDSSPQLATLEKIAKVLEVKVSLLTDPSSTPENCPADWEITLVDGTNLESERKESFLSRFRERRTLKYLEGNLRADGRLVPLLSWWDSFRPDPYLADASYFYPCPVECSHETFCVRVESDSYEPLFSKKDILFIDPLDRRSDIILAAINLQNNSPEQQSLQFSKEEIAKQSKSFTLRALYQNTHVFCRRLLEEKGDKFLIRINEHLPTDAIPYDSVQFIGKVVARMTSFK